MFRPRGACQNQMEHYGTRRKESTNAGSFRKVAKDTIVQDDVMVTISNMRTAIANTHVILNSAIMLGLIPINPFGLKDSDETHSVI